VRLGRADDEHAGREQLGMTALASPVSVPKVPSVCAAIQDLLTNRAPGCVLALPCMARTMTARAGTVIAEDHSATQRQPSGSL
jgi:hypothetical protein